MSDVGEASPVLFLAVRYPEKVRRLAIMNTMFFPDYRWHFWARVWRTPLLGELSFAVNTRWGLTQEMRRGSKRLRVARPQGFRQHDAGNDTRHRTPSQRVGPSTREPAWARASEGRRLAVGRREFL